ncbi:uncharacterized protein LOC132752142 isoform X2 [Ruditapes philippinarum]|uniref:uncharacterized protein LOC132752142 isoform X2 n=1 Tax=Ruditapes philippinarum TaxID=129788 RepID=UPI00295B45C6|nr:uncharacterized protein LOC132752142 isoform X2 [Ruditapes philippinarum]
MVNMHILLTEVFCERCTFIPYCAVAEIRGEMSYFKIQTIANSWAECRLSTVTSLRRCADKLESSHRTNAETEHSIAKVSLTGDVVGLFGVILAPFSGGLSLGLCGVSAVTGIGTYLSKREANQNDDNVTRQVEAEVKQVLDEDEKATTTLRKLCESFTFLEEQLEIKMVGDILVAIQETSCTNLEITVGDIQKNDCAVQIQNGNNLNTPVLNVTTQLANLNASLTSANEVIQYIETTKEVVTKTKTIKQVLSTANSINKLSKAARSLDVAELMNTSGQIASAAKTVTKAAKTGKAITTATKGADTTIKTVKNIKKASDTMKTITKVAKNASGQVASATKTITKAAKTGGTITTATKGADTTIKTVKNIKQASDTVKTVTHVAKDATGQIASAAQTVTKAAKTGRAISTATKGADTTIKTVKNIKKASDTMKTITKVAKNASGQVASATKTITKAAKTGGTITTATKGADATIKTVKNIKQASNTVKTVTKVAKDVDKVVHTSRLTTSATKVTKVTQTATKAASISKLGLIINAVVIPLDLYNLVVAAENLGKSHEDVKFIRDEADRLEHQIENIENEIKVHVETYMQLHVQLCEIYENYHYENIYEYLEVMHESLEFPLPTR